jgi:hypothetical protein
LPNLLTDVTQQIALALSTIEIRTNQVGPSLTRAPKFTLRPFDSLIAYAQAQIITVGSGEDRAGLDLQMRLVPGSRVSGTLTGPDGPVANIGLKLVPVDKLDLFAGAPDVSPSDFVSARTPAFALAECATPAIPVVA